MICSVIVAAAANEVIGRDGGLPWRLPGDLRRFRAITAGHVLLMGRVTHESILARLGRPLPGRTSVVVTRSAPGACGPGVTQVGSVERGLAAAARLAAEAGGEEFFVAGGASVYGQALPFTDRVHLTRIHQDVAGDAAMPAGWLEGFDLTAQEPGPGDGPPGGYSFLTYTRART